MPLTKEQKREVIENLKEKTSRQRTMIFVAISGLKVRDLFELRKRLKKVDSQLTVVKKTLMRIVLKEKKIVSLDPKKMEGEMAVVFGFQNEISPAKIVYDFSLGNKNLKILGGFFENKFRETEEIITLAQLPSKEELLARLVRGISTPISNFINVLQGNLRSLVYILKQVKS